MQAAKNKGISAGFTGVKRPQWNPIFTTRMMHLSKTLLIISSCCLMSGHAMAMPMQQNSAVEVQAQGIGAITSAGSQSSSHLSVILQNRSGVTGVTPQAHARGSASMHLSTGLTAGSTSVQITAVTMSAQPNNSAAGTPPSNPALHWIRNPGAGVPPKMTTNIKY